MTKLHQEELLQELYKQSKSAEAQPKEITSKVINYAKQKANPFSFMMRWQTVTAAFLLAFIWLQFDKDVQPTYSITTALDHNNERVYFHDVRFQLSGESDNTREIEESRNAYLNSLAKLDNASYLTGTVTQAGESVVVEVCQIGLVKLSPTMLARLDKSQAIAQLRVGQSIQLETNEQGMFVAINQGFVSNTEQCAE